MPRSRSVRSVSSMMRSITSKYAGLSCGWRRLRLASVHTRKLRPMKSHSALVVRIFSSSRWAPADGSRDAYRFGASRPSPRQAPCWEGWSFREKWARIGPSGVPFPAVASLRSLIARSGLVAYEDGSTTWAICRWLGNSRRGSPGGRLRQGRRGPVAAVGDRFRRPRRGAERFDHVSAGQGEARTVGHHPVDRRPIPLRLERRSDRRTAPGDRQRACGQGGGAEGVGPRQLARPLGSCRRGKEDRMDAVGRRAGCCSVSLRLEVGPLAGREQGGTMSARKRGQAPSPEAASLREALLRRRSQSPSLAAGLGSP